jgi:hypothetical protein
MMPAKAADDALLQASQLGDAEMVAVLLALGANTEHTCGQVSCSESLLANCARYSGKLVHANYRVLRWRYSRADSS